MNLNFEQQRKRAKDLVRAAGEREAVERVARQLTSRDASPLKLSEAQFVVARKAGFSSWPAMQRSPLAGA